MPAFLDIPPDKFFGVFLEYGVDLVEEVIDVFADLLDPLGDLGIDLGRYLIDLIFTPRFA
ncbi:hypothetical protein Rhe02_76870 [Rhizocola hellebori]|uniref:Uncharacterized protein n=1 Tax=Rhizocola hellebori TaxID=1392758 RepID=A0A8J3QH51_9ACTN|nr:hypothetical protein Rhe02_76870 [Rhizocola hellebori]